MIIGIGSTNRVKIGACEEAFDAMKMSFPDIPRNLRFSAFKTHTTVADMPLSQPDIMEGALQRALFVFDQPETVHYAVGMEGGVFKIRAHTAKRPQAYLQNWVYISNGKEGYFGSSAALVLPQKISDALFEEHLELAPVIDRLSGKTDVRSHEGAFGILTGNLISRRHAFKEAVINAMVPFLNKTYYLDSTG